MIPITGVGDDVLSHWGLTGDVVLERAALGTMNQVFIVRRDMPEFVLRAHRHRERRLVDLEHDVMEVARLAGVPAPRCIRTREGARSVAVHDRYWSLLEWLPGDHIGRSELTATGARSMGETLAAIHSALATFPPVPGESRDRKTDTIGRIDHLLEVIEQLPTSGPDEELAIRWLRAQRIWLLQRSGAQIAVRRQIQVVHGDYHDANVLFDGDVVSGVIDWDKAGAGSPGEEVVRCAHLSFNLDPTTTGAFLDGYRWTRRLDDHDLDGAAARYGYERDRSIWLFEDLYIRGNNRLRRLLNDRPFVPFEHSWSALRQHL